MRRPIGLSDSKALTHYVRPEFRKHPLVQNLGKFPFLWIVLCINSVICFTGKNCQTVLAPCSPNPCENAAVCKEAPNFESYTCLCAPGWQGNDMGMEKPRVLSDQVVEGMVF